MCLCRYNNVWHGQLPSVSPCRTDGDIGEAMLCNNFCYIRRRPCSRTGTTAGPGILKFHGCDLSLLSPAFPPFLFDFGGIFVSFLCGVFFVWLILRGVFRRVPKRTRGVRTFFGVFRPQRGSTNAELLQQTGPPYAAPGIGLNMFALCCHKKKSSIRL